MTVLIAELQVTKKSIVVHAEKFFSTQPPNTNKVVIGSALLNATKSTTIILTILAIRFSSFPDSVLNDVNVVISSLICLIFKKKKYFLKMIIQNLLTFVSLTWLRQVHSSSKFTNKDQCSYVLF